MRTIRRHLTAGAIGATTMFLAINHTEAKNFAIKAGELVMQSYAAGALVTYELPNGKKPEITLNLALFSVKKS